MDPLEMSLDAITDSNKEAHRSSRPAKGKGGRGRGNKGKGGSKGRGRGSKGGFKGGFGGGGAARQGRSYGARRQAPYQGGAFPRRNIVNDDFDDEEDDFEDEEEEEEEEEYEAPARGLQTKSARAALSTGTSVQVSNLHADVTEEDMHELFSTAISGEAPVSIKSTCVNYDKNGKCNGTATITFVRKGDAMAAIKEYNGVPLDGQPMQLDIVGAPITAAPVRSRPQFRAERSFEPRQQTFQRNTLERNSRGRGKGKGSKGGKGRGGGKGPREDRAPVTESDLDDGLDDYFKEE